MTLHRRTHERIPQIGGARVALIVARFYEDLAEQLEDGARRALAACGVRPDDIVTYGVPGCFELPLASKLALDAGFDACVALGVVIRGDTPHFDYVAGECARGIMDVQLAAGKPIGFGVLTTDTRAQAEERADPERGDKGFEAALAAATITAFRQGVAR
ncbi:MAG: 6,7-dimethyl-8-ribityllumazine synthase [Vulcanimicrobiaceae bacterium]